MSNFEKVKTALIIYCSQYGYPIELSSSDLASFIPIFTMIDPISTSAISTIGRDNSNFELQTNYTAAYLGSGNWSIIVGT